MASQGNQEYVESDEDTEDDDYTPVDDDTEDEFREEQAEEALLEIEVLDVPYYGSDGAGERSEGEGEDGDEDDNAAAASVADDGEGDDDHDVDDDHDDVVVVEVGRVTPRGQECDESSRGVEAQLGSHSDATLLSCPICFNPWASDGPHRVCCIPCGHVYGRSCLERWIKQCKMTKIKCPQCSTLFKKNGMINLYAPLIAVPNCDLEKEVMLLREKNESLKAERDLLMEELNRSRKMVCIDVASAGALERSSRPMKDGWVSSAETLSENRLRSQNNLNINDSSHHRCVLQNEFSVRDARVLGIDPCSQICIISGKKPGQVGEHTLSKISLLGRHEFDQIELPPCTGVVRDMHILPGSLALIASLGKKLSVLSIVTNNIVIKYDLPVPAWSCSGDVNEPNHIYTGLQNGMLLVFDIRQTARCLESIKGLSTFPIHTVCSLKQNSCSRKVLTASSVGPCLWDVSGYGERPLLIPDLESEGICISLACGSSNGDIIASFRPKIELPMHPMPTQIAVPPSQRIHSDRKLGSHVNIKRINGTHFQKGHAVSGYVSGLRMSKSALVNAEGSSPLFAFGDELTHGLCLWNLPSLQFHSRHQPHQYPILDLKFSCLANSGFLGCLSEDKLQIFTCF